MIKWNEKKMSWYYRSGMIEPYFKDIVESIKDYLKNADVIEVGCGIGITSYLASKYAKSVLGIDMQKEAVEFTKTTFSRDNLSFKNYNLFDLEEKSCDVLLGVLVGPILDTDINLLKIARNYTILVSSADEKELEEKHCGDNHELLLKNNNIDYKKFYIDSSFGQYFESMEDALNFIKEYEKMDKKDEILNSLIKVEGKFPLYLEKKKRRKVLIIESNKYV